MPGEPCRAKAQKQLGRVGLNKVVTKQRAAPVALRRGFHPPQAVRLYATSRPQALSTSVCSAGKNRSPNSPMCMMDRYMS